MIGGEEDGNYGSVEGKAEPRGQGVVGGHRLKLEHVPLRFAPLLHRSLTRDAHRPQGYVAPEILTGTPYDESADMWSVGVILYILLGGYPPFIDDNQRRLFRKIRKGQYEFHEEYWGPVSDDAKNLISSLLCVKSEQRLTAREALQCNWIALASDASLEKNDMMDNLIAMRRFNGKRKFRAAVKSVIAVNKLQNFLAFDTFQPGSDLLETW